MDLAVAQLLSQPVGKSLSGEDGSVLAAGAPEGKLGAVAAAAAQILDERCDPALEHFKELVEAAPRAEEVFDGPVLAVKRGYLLHERARIWEEAHINHQIRLWRPCLEGKGRDNHVRLAMHVCHACTDLDLHGFDDQPGLRRNTRLVPSKDRSTRGRERVCQGPAAPLDRELAHWIANLL
jgi:hypothetical protein